MKYKSPIEKDSTVVFFFGECNPPTPAHILMFSAVVQTAKKLGAEYYIIISRNQDKVQNPLSLTQKLEYLKIQFPSVKFTAATDSMQTPLDIVEHFNKKFKNIIMVCGEDQVSEYQKMFDNNKSKYDYKGMKAISTGERNPDTDNISTKSSQKLRQFAQSGNFQQFRKGLMSHVREIDGKRMMNDIRTGMGLSTIKENLNLNTSDLRERYRNGEVFAVDSYVISENVIFKIINRNNNYLTLVNETGIICKKWLTDVEEHTPDENVITKFGEISEMKFNSSDKLKVAKIIGGVLGADTEKSTNPESIVNAGLKIARSKPLNDEAKSILKKMLQTADAAGIKYDSSILDGKVTEDTEIKMVSADRKISPSGRKVPAALKPDSGQIPTKKLVTTEAFENQTDVSEATVDHHVKALSIHKTKLNKAICDYAKPFDPTDKAEDDAHSQAFKAMNHHKPAVHAHEVAINHIKSKSKEAGYYSSQANKFKLNENLDEAKKDPTEEHHDNIRARVEQAHVKGQRHFTLYKSDQIIADNHHAKLNAEGGPQVELPQGMTKQPASEFSRRSQIMKVKEAEEVNPSDDFDFSEEDIDAMVNSFQDENDIMDAYEDNELHIVDAESGESLGSLDTLPDRLSAEVDEVPDDEKDETNFEAGTNNESVINEVLTRMDRIKAGIRMRIHHSGMARKCKIAMTKHSSSQKLGHRARLLAVKAMKIKIMHKPVNQFTVQDKERCERILKSRASVINRVALKLIPRVRKIEQTRLSHPAFTQPAQ